MDIEHQEKRAEKMKPILQFYFADEPQFAVNCDRAWLANALRAYRKHPKRYQLKRLGLHWYTVRCGDSVAVISA
jgi:hypothetical protein